MRSWLALIVAPSLALLAQAIMFALVTPSCMEQTRSLIHGVAAVFFVITAVLTVLAYTDWKRYGALPGQPPDSDEADPASTRRFVAMAATGVAALSTLVMLAMWIGVWVLWPCGQLH